MGWLIFLCTFSRNEIPHNRISIDFHVNSKFRRSSEMLKLLGLTTANGRIRRHTCELTCFTFNEGQRLNDFAIVTPKMYCICEQLNVHDFEHYSLMNSVPLS